MMTSVELADLVLAKAKHIVEEVGAPNLLPVAFIVADDDSMGIIPMPWDCPERKERMLGALRFALQDQEAAKLCAIVSEAWSVTIPDGESGEGVLPSKDPRRVSVVLVSVESRDGESFSLRAEIKEMEGGRRTLGEPRRSENSGGAITDVFGTRKRRAH